MPAVQLLALALNQQRLARLRVVLLLLRSAGSTTLRRLSGSSTTGKQ
jgi:hypothetical protein